MSGAPEVPVVKVTGNEDAALEQFGPMAEAARMGVKLRLPEVDKDYAGDGEVSGFVKNSLSALMTFIRQDRQTLEAEWRAIMRMEWMMHDEGQRYRGRSNSYLPIYTRIHQTLVSALSRGLFPSDEYMDVVDRKPTAENINGAKAVKTYLQWEFERVGQVRKKIKPWLRSLSAFGNAPLKFWYAKETREEGRKYRSKDSARGVPEFRPTTTYEGLRVSPRNIFHWYIWPYTADSLDEATLVFEDISVPRAYIEEMVRLKRWPSSALSAPTPESHQTNEQARLTTMGLSTVQGSPVQGGTGDVRVITECWTFMRLPKSAYMDGEDPGCAVPVKIVMAGTEPLEVRRNPFFHQRPPYLFGRLNAQAGLVYGYGNGRMVRPLQYLSNDFSNQTADCGSFSLNPVVIANPNVMAGPMRPLSPGVTWYMTDPDGVRFERPDIGIIDGGIAMINLFRSMADDLGGAPPQIQGSSSMQAKTATQAQILQHNAMQPLQDIVEDIELDVMVPLMFGTWVNAQQYRNEEIMTLVAGQPIKIDPEMLLIDPEMRYLASSQAMNQAQRAQQILGYLQQLMPAIPYLNQLGWIVDPTFLYKRALVDGFGMRIPPEMFQKVGPQTPMGMPPAPGVQEQQGNAVRSATEQAAGGGLGMMEPGEGEAFMDVREGADQLAAMMGGNNGKA